MNLCLPRVISSLGVEEGGGLAWAIGRPLVASLAMAIVSPLIAYLVLKPIYSTYVEQHVLNRGVNVALLIGICVLLSHLAV
jgi:hypothetical protein